MLLRLMSKSEFLIVPKGTKFAGPGKLGLKVIFTLFTNFAQIFIFMIFQHDTESQVV